MAKIGLFLADGCEEIEALTVVDILRRAGIEILTLSITDSLKVAGAHSIIIEADALAKSVDLDEFDGLVLPGGMPGTTNLGACEAVTSAIKKFNDEGRLLCAICAAPSVLGMNGILEGKEAVCYPGFEDKLLGAKIGSGKVAVSGNCITSRGMGTAIDFALAITAHFLGREKADSISRGIIFTA